MIRRNFSITKDQPGKLAEIKVVTGNTGAKTVRLAIDEYYSKVIEDLKAGQKMPKTIRPQPKQ